MAAQLHADTDGSLAEQLNLDTQHYRFLLSLREDYLPNPEEWTDRKPRPGGCPRIVVVTRRSHFETDFSNI